MRKKTNSFSTTMAGTRGSMDLLTEEKAPPDIKIHAIGGRDVGDRRRLHDAVKKTNQAGSYQKLKTHGFELAQPKSAVMCYFPITLVKLKGRIPKVGDTEGRDVPEDHYMFFEDQAKWNRKYLTHTYSDKEKQQGFTIVSDPQTFSVSNYYEGLPNSVLKSTRYKDPYMQKYAANYSELDAEGVKEEYYVFLCNVEITNQVDYNEHCSRLHGVTPRQLTQEQNIRVDSKIPFKLESALDIEHVGPEDHDNILGTWFYKGVTTAFLSKSSSKAETHVNPNRSREMLNEIINVTTKNFSNLFCCKLREDVGDID